MATLRKTNLLIASSVLAAAVSGVAVAQTAVGKSSDDLTLEEIVVTAERREQRLQDVAATVQAFTADDLNRLGVNADFQNLQVVVPGLQISQNEGSNEIYIRGVGSPDTEQFSSDGATAVHYNGIYIPRTRGIGPMLYDLERVGISKGPQGTLRGRNATAGTINIITRRPDFKDVAGYTMAGAGTFDASNFDVALNVPLGDSLAVRGAVFYRTHDDYFRNGLQNGVSGAGAEQEFAGRLSALWQPNERFSALLIYDRAETDGTGFPGNFFGQAFSEGYTIGDLDNRARNQNFLTQGRVTNDVEGVTAVLSYDFGPFILEYDGGYRTNELANVNPWRPFQNGVVIPSNTDPSVSPGAGFAFDPDNFGTLYIGEDSTTQVHELRAFAPNSARFRWSIGAFYLDEAVDGFRFDTSDKSAVQASLGGEVRSDVKVESLSFFTDETFDVTNRLRVKGGVRWTDDKKSDAGFLVAYQFNFPGVSPDQIRFSTPGYIPTGPGERRFYDPAATSPAAFFLDGVASFGSRDTLDDLIAANPAAVTLTTSPGGLVTRRHDESYIDWRAGVKFDLTPENLLYATISTGSHAGGINPILVLPDGTVSPSEFDREKLTAYEVGTKNELEFGGNHLRLNGSVFLYEYDDQVLATGVAGDGSIIEPGQPFGVNGAIQNVNVAKSHVLGAELDFGIHLPYGFDIGLLLTYLDSEFDDASISDGRQFFFDGRLPPNVDVSGNPLVNVSKWNILARLGQAIGTSWGSVDWTLTGSYRSEFFLSPFAGRRFDTMAREIPLADMATLFGQSGLFFQDRVDDVFLLNANLGTTFGKDRQYRFEGFVSNITDEAYSQRQIMNFFVNINFVSQPRTAGARFTVQF